MRPIVATAQVDRLPPQCGLCESVSGGGASKFWNRPLLEATNFVVLPSLGALVEGWLLIIPRQHIISAASLSDQLRREMNDLKKEVCEVLAEAYGPVVVFEHGPAAEGRSVGCGVDHAHVHVVPLTIDLVASSQQYVPGKVKFRRGTLDDCREATERGLDYLYVEQPVGVGYFALSDQFERQTFRRGIASALGVPQEYCWREHPHFDNVQATNARLSQLLALEEAAVS